MATEGEDESTTPPPSDPRIHEASLGSTGSTGSVVKGPPITQAQAEARRRAGRDVVVCGPDLAINRRLAGEIERNASGTAKRCPPHPSSGPNALPHYQPDPRPPEDIRSMKPLIERPFKPVMRFFTPELFARFNADDDEVADRANEEWERAIQDYRKYLDLIKSAMPASVRELSELCLHDAEFLALGQSDEAWPPSRVEPATTEHGIAICSVEQAGCIISLGYSLRDGVRRYQTPGEWPFSMRQRHWLYDEIEDVPGTPGAFFHRILISDGSVLEIPFASALIHRLRLEGLTEVKSPRVSA